MMMVDDGGGRGVKNGQKSDDVINGRPLKEKPNLEEPVKKGSSYVKCTLDRNDRNQITE